MASRRTKLVTAATLITGGAGYFIYSLFAAQGQGSELAQAPLNTQVQIMPAFIMGVDNSGSMSFQNQFPRADGYACWDSVNDTFFKDGGVLVTDSNHLKTDTVACRYSYSYTSQSIGWANYKGIPPVDAYGFSRSSDFNPAYFNPSVKYLPWVDSKGQDYPQANPSETRIHPGQSETIKLASNLKRAKTDTEFFAFRGMTLPKDTEFRRVNSDGACLEAGDQFPTDDEWTVLDEDYVIPDTAYTKGNTAYTGFGCRIYVKYWPATFFMRAGWHDGVNGDAEPKLDGESVYGRAYTDRVKIHGGCGPNCDLWKYTLKSSDTKALQNFANWFSFYGNRQRAMIAGMTRSLSEVSNMRVGYFRINDLSRKVGSETKYDNFADLEMFNMSRPLDRDALYAKMLALNVSGSTPNLPAAEYMGRQFRRVDAGAPVQLACQRNAGMLFTDGFSNVAISASNHSAPEVSGLGAPFDPTEQDSIAAIASQFYFGESPLGDVNSKFPRGLVPVPEACSTLSRNSADWKRLDCQANLHMNFYGITLGGRGAQFDPENIKDPFVDPVTWPGYKSGSNTTVDDIWHATVNTRGEFVSARTPADITNAMRRILTTVSKGASPSGSIGMTGARVGGGSLTLTPRYQVENEGTDWSSTLTAHRARLDPDTREVEMEFMWEASNKLPAPAARNIFYSGAGGIKPFNTGNGLTLDVLCESHGCDGDDLKALGSGATLANALLYLRGDTSLEFQLGGPFRDRTTRLGDIVNSTPVVSSPTDDYGYRSLNGDLGSSYGEYLKTKMENRRYMAYVGANDGMLHAFDMGLDKERVDSGLPPDSNLGGVEQFAFIPRSVLGWMGNLLFPLDHEARGPQKFQHHYYVDGPVVVSDAHFNDSWRTVLLGSTGAGAPGVFALDVSSPGHFGASHYLWEINADSPGDVGDDIGHVLGKPVIVPVKDPRVEGGVRWMAVFGNGYDSHNQRAVLFLVDVGSGKVTRMIASERGTANSVNGFNGLGNVVVVDRWTGDDLDHRGRDGYADTVYAADRKGALWKFDIRNLEDGADIHTPLFTTRIHEEGGRRYRQPITGGLAAATGPDGGVMVYFGTGSFAFLDDPKDMHVQSLYAVNDTDEAATSHTVDIDDLTHYVSKDIDGGSTRTVDQKTPQRGRGWYVDLPAGERFVGNPDISAGVVFLPTYSPDPDATGCATDGFNFLFGLNARTGAPEMSRARFGSTGGSSPPDGTAAVELDTGGTAPVRDVAVMAIPRVAPPVATDDDLPGGGGTGGGGNGGGGGGGPGKAPPAPPAQGCWMLVSVAGAEAMYMPYPCGRQSWRQLQ